jgi:putative ABC transport system permease protein
MRHLGLIWANLHRRPVRNLTAMVAVASAFILYGLALGEAVGFRRAAAARRMEIGGGFLHAALAVSLFGIVLILLLVTNALAQSVRLRISEFGILKAIGYSHRLVLMLVTMEAVLLCLAGAALGLAVGPLLFMMLARLLPPLAVVPPPVYTPGILAGAIPVALMMGAISGAIPASRIVRLGTAAALTGGNTGG